MPEAHSAVLEGIDGSCKALVEATFVANVCSTRQYFLLRSVAKSEGSLTCFPTLFCRATSQRVLRHSEVLRLIYRCKVLHTPFAAAWGWIVASRDPDPQIYPAVEAISSPGYHEKYQHHLIDGST